MANCEHWQKLAIEYIQHQHATRHNFLAYGT